MGKAGEAESRVELSAEVMAIVEESVREGYADNVLEALKKLLAVIRKDMKGGEAGERVEVIERDNQGSI